MVERPALFAWLTPRRAAFSGFAALVCLVGGVAAAYAAFPGYRLTLRYISELAHRTNPGRHWFTLGLCLAGPLIAAFATGLHHLMTNRPGRLAARFLTATGLSMPFVALFDLDLPVPHFTAATVLFGSAVVGTVLAGVGFRRMAAEASGPEARTLRLASGLAFGVFGLQVTSTLAGLVFTGVLVARMTVTSATQLLKELPKHQTLQLGPDGPLLNPVALLEWVFLATAMALILLASVYSLSRSHR